MKTILYNPIFINPQAYYVFPRLTRYLQPDNESTAEPANYIGTIEVKVIAYGDTTLKRTYTNTDSIDLSEFKNTWIRISLFTKVGSCVLGEWKIGNMESDLPYIDPEVLASLKAVVIVGNKTNNDSDRAIVKNLVDPDNPFVISNAAYTEGSGYADKDSPYYGAFVTDGIDDLITSTKTVQEMLGGSNEITVVSMAHFIKGESNAPEICRINQIRRDTRSIRNSISKIGKSGIFGYTYKNGVTTINNILGDKNDCTAEGNLDGIVEKQMVFKTTATYLLDNNEPKCILSPSRLRIPNSSYKLLGYIPDISGHGNHGKINNSAYAGMSGVNGYPVVFGANKTWANESNGYVTSITSNTIHITNVLNAGLALLYSYVKYNGNLQNIKEIPPFKIEIKGLEGRSKFIYKYLATSDATKETNLYLGNGTHELPKSFLPTEALINNAVVGFSISPIEEGVTNFLSDITIKVLPEYEGAYCLDGVDDFVTIPTTVGGKQVLMKVNWDSSNSALLYDQRGYNNEFAIYNGSADSDGNPIPAYQGRNNGQTYIDGILNSNIKASELRAITHNITITNELSAGVNKFSPVIGSNRVHNAYFTNMALYDFMLFDNISTDDKIKQLNEYVGIEGNTEWRKTK